MSKLKGFYDDLSNEDYHGDKTHFSSTTLKVALKGCTKFHNTVILGLNPITISKSAANFGNYMHTAWLEPELLESTCEVAPCKTRKGAIFTEFEMANPDKYIITMSELEVADELNQALNNSTFDVGEEEDVPGTKLFTGGKAEQSLFTELKGVPVKVRFDYLIYQDDKVIIRDLKTTSGSADSPQDADYVCQRYNYYLSAALYCDALRTQFKDLGIDEDTPIEFQLVFASKTDKNLNIYKVSEAKLQKGREEYERALELIKKWQKNGFKEGLREL